MIKIIRPSLNAKEKSAELKLFNSAHKCKIYVFLVVLVKFQQIFSLFFMFLMYLLTLNILYLLRMSINPTFWHICVEQQIGFTFIGVVAKH